MSMLMIAIVGSIVATILCEWILWSMFSVKMKPLEFPHELDTSYFHFFSLPRLRIIAIIHTICIATLLTALCFYLW